jgi:hypothetical protein
MPDVRILGNNTARRRVIPLTPSQATLFAIPARRRLIFCLLLIVGTVVVYFPALHNGFVNYDDPRYIIENSHIQSGATWQSIRWAATAYYESNWHPLTWISHALDVSLFHLNPAGHHAVNFLLHTLNALLLFFVLQDATKRDWASFFVAALFAVHPVNVESVAWASERKNVLSMFFLLLALYASVDSSILRCRDFVRARPHRQTTNHRTAFLTFVVGFLAVATMESVCRLRREQQLERKSRILAPLC